MTNKQQIIELYRQNYSSQEIKDKLLLPITTRSIQRIVKSAGIIRTVGDAFRLAISKDRVKWAYKENKKHRTKIAHKLRYFILSRDSFKCVLCGSNITLEVDHIDDIPNNNIESNLRTLCHSCNVGKQLNQ